MTIIEDWQAIDWATLPAPTFQRAIAERKGWSPLRILRDERLGYVLYVPGEGAYGRDGFFWHGNPRERTWLAGDTLSYEEVWHAAPNWLYDLNVAVELLVEMRGWLMPHRDGGRWECMLGIGEVAFKHGAYHDSPARAICMAWIQWWHEQQEEGQ